MKKTAHIFVVLFATSSIVSAQTFSTPVKNTLDACIALANAIESFNTDGLRYAISAYHNCQAAEYSSLVFLTKDTPSLDGHFVWNESFVSDLIEGRDVRRFAQKYATERANRESSFTADVYTTTATVAAGSSTKFKLHCRRHQDIAIVAEPNGLVTLRIHDLTNDKWYNDTIDVKEGRQVRSKSIELSDDICEFEFEVINCINKDISFVIIGN